MPMALPMPIGNDNSNGKKGKKPKETASKEADEYKGLPAPPGYVREHDDPNANDPHPQFVQRKLEETSEASEKQPVENNGGDSESNDQPSLPEIDYGEGAIALPPVLKPLGQVGDDPDNTDSLRKLGIFPKGGKPHFVNMDWNDSPINLKLQLIGSDDEVGDAKGLLEKFLHAENELQKNYKMFQNETKLLDKDLKLFSSSLERKTTSRKRFSSKKSKALMEDIVTTLRIGEAELYELMADNRKKFAFIQRLKLKLIMTTNTKSVARLLHPLTSKNLQALAHQAALEGIKTLREKITETGEKLQNQMAQLTAQEDNYNAVIKKMNKRISFYQDGATKVQHELQSIQAMTDRTEMARTQLMINLAVSYERNRNLTNENFNLRRRGQELVLILDSAGVGHGPDQDQLAAELQELRDKYADMSRMLQECQMEVLWHQTTSASNRPPLTMFGLPILICFVVYVFAVFVLVIMFAFRY